MTEEEFTAIMRDVFDGLQEYYVLLDREDVREFVAKGIWYAGVQDLGDPQRNYERLRDRAEYFIEHHVALARRMPGMFDWEAGE